MKLAKIQKWFNGLSPLVQIAIVGVTLFLLWRGYRFIKSYITTKGMEAEQKGEIKALEDAGITATFKKHEYDDFAQALDVAMRGPGTDEDAVYSVFYKMQNDIDIMKLETAFGSRSHWGSGGDLRDWLRGDLSASEMKKLNQILESKGITKRF